MDHQQDVLRLEAGMAAFLRAQFREAIDQVSSALTDLNRHGYLATPWLSDEVSNTVAAHYKRRAMDDPDSSYKSLLAYRDELTKVHDALHRMEDEYHRTDNSTAADIQRRT